jgi:hypothetical protein
MPVGLFWVVSAFYLLAALATLRQLIRGWRGLLDARWTAADRELAQRVGMLLLVPPAVWLHEWGHATAMWLYGATDPAIHFYFYWGYVTSSVPFTPLQSFVVALAGPLVTYALGWAMLAVALLLPLRPAIALALATCGMLQLMLVLVLYPALSLLGGWGDFTTIYRAGVPLGSLVVGIVHAASLAALAWLMGRAWMRGFWGYPCPRPWRVRWVMTSPASAPPPEGQ